MTSPRAHRAAPPDRPVRLSKAASAAATIGPIEPRMDVYAMTFGQFDLSDVIAHVLDGTGPAELVVSTWTAAHADLTRARRLLDDQRITRCRFIVDRSFPTRQPGYYRGLVEHFGPESIRVARTHAKYALVTAPNWRISVRTSMNLNANPRLETVEVSDEPALHDFLLDVTDAIYAEDLPDDGLPHLAGIRDVATAPAVRMGRVVV